MSNSSGPTRQTNYYEVLDITPNAAPIEIERAYQRAYSLYVVGTTETKTAFSTAELTELSRMIEEAHSVLSDPMRRKDYDESRSRDHVSSHLGEVIGVTEDYVIRRRMDHLRPHLADGMARTAYSTYTIDQEIENHISTCEVFDGAFLNRIRTYKNLSLELLADATRVSRTYLTAIEKNDYKNLPAPVFVRGYIIHLARIFGLDENKVAASYMKILREKVEK
jgi:hypothetical protein